MLKTHGGGATTTTTREEFLVQYVEEMDATMACGRYAKGVVQHAQRRRKITEALGVVPACMYLNRAPAADADVVAVVVVWHVLEPLLSSRWLCATCSDVWWLAHAVVDRAKKDRGDPAPFLERDHPLARQLIEYAQAIPPTDHATIQGSHVLLHGLVVEY